jgi:hypothetical protein
MRQLPQRVSRKSGSASYTLRINCAQAGLGALRELARDFGAARRLRALGETVYEIGRIKKARSGPEAVLS